MIEEYYNFSGWCSQCHQHFGEWSQHFYDYPNEEKAPEPDLRPWLEPQASGTPTVSEVVYPSQPGANPVPLYTRFLNFLKSDEAKDLKAKGVAGEDLLREFSKKQGVPVVRDPLYGLGKTMGQSGDSDEPIVMVSMRSKQSPAPTARSSMVPLTKENIDMDTAGIRERLATSTHYLRYFVLGGYLAFLSQVPNFLRSSVTIADLAILGAAITTLSIVMDLRNYLK